MSSSLHEPSKRNKIKYLTTAIVKTPNSYCLYILLGNFKIMVKITTDTDCEMIKIENDKGECIFYGNEWDFNRDAKTFKKLFDKLGVKTEIVEKPYDEWG